MNGNILHRYKDIYSKPASIIAVAILFFLPLIFIGTHSSHDWGDDFAQYIQQAANIVNGAPQTESTFIYSPESSLGPPAYTVGFPLILAPVYAFAGNSISAFILYISVFYFLLGIVMMVFYRQFFGKFVALALTLIFIYNPQMLVFKREVMSDIPFTFLLVICFILYSQIRQGKTNYSLWLGISVGFLLVLRPTGFAFWLALCIDQIVLIRSNKAYNIQSVVHLLLKIVVPILVYIIFNSILFPVSSGGSFTHYFTMILSGGFIRLMADNFTINVLTFRYMYEPESGILKGFSIIMGSGLLIFTVLGFIKRLFNKPGLIEWFFILYIFMLLVFPYQNSWFRLMVPIGFIFLLYAAQGFKMLNLDTIAPKRWVTIALAIAIFMLYVPGIFQVCKAGNQVLEGPQQIAAKEAFAFIQGNVPAKEIVVFAKPRALALYSGCRSLCDPFTNDPTKLHAEISNAGANYLLIHKTLTAQKMHRYVQVMKNRLTTVWANSDFTLYRINP